jgi:aspartyl-tRNA(Asn)/glutamyl-tRNA(Gln) amidotransferase subunit A
MSDLADLTLTEAASAIREGQLSPLELTRHHLDRIEATEPDLHAYATVATEQALAQARRATEAVARGELLGPLHGVPLGIKDLFDTAGLRTTYGSPRFADHVPESDATAVHRLRRAGAIVLGKHTTHELAWGGRTDSAFFGPTHNPWRRGHIAGGSSGGSAASVVAGSCLGAIGSDTAGSVRIPAALSGCVGYKPTRGRVSLHGVMPLAPSLDHVGSLARSVADAAAIVDAVAGPDPADPRTLDERAPLGDTAPERLRIAVVGGWGDAVLDPGVRRSLAEATGRMQSTGLDVTPVELPVDLPGRPSMTEAVLTRILAEAGPHHRDAFEADPDGFGADIAELMARPPVTPREMAHAESVIAGFSADLLALLIDYDVLVTATVPVTAPELGATTVEVGGVTYPVELVLTRLTSPFNATGLPAVSVPMARVGGLPTGLQIVGRRLDDGSVLAAAAAVEQILTPRTETSR